jgi:hypothetical protein
MVETNSFYRYVLISSMAVVLAGGTEFESTWKIVKRPGQDAGSVVVLNRLDRILPSYGEDLSLAIQATAKGANGSGDLTSTIHDIYEKMDQPNAQLRNFLVSCYATYINTELDPDPNNRANGRKQWINLLTEANDSIMSFRVTAVATGDADVRIERILQRYVDELPALEFFDDAPGRHLVEMLRTETTRLEDIERTLPEAQHSQIALIARCILDYQDKDYGSTIAKISRFHLEVPILYYTLASSYARLRNFDKAWEATVTFGKLADWAQNKRLSAMALNQKGFIRALQNNNNCARKYFQQSVEMDDTYWVPYYNLAGMALKPKIAAATTIPTTSPAPSIDADQKEACVAQLCNFAAKSGKSSDVVIQYLETDPDHTFDSLLKGAAGQWDQTVINELKKRLDGRASKKGTIASSSKYPK